MKNQLYTTTSSDSEISVGKDRIPRPGDFSIPNPQSVGFDVCTTLPNGNQICTSMVGDFTPSQIPCASQQVWKAPFEMINYEIDYKGVAYKNWSVTMYVAASPDGCVFFGGEGPTGNQFCKKANCNRNMHEVPIDVYKQEQVENANTAGDTFAQVAGDAVEVGTPVAVVAAAVVGVGGGKFAFRAAGS